jgi:pimeloyl-ACP methyl ester carboxylesterase
MWLTMSRSHGGLRRAAVLVVWLMAMVSCASESVGDSTGRTANQAVFGWKPCATHAECGSLVVPLDYDDPSAGQVTLRVVRHRALQPKQRIGSLFVNPGGPGAGGSFLAENAEKLYDKALVNRFDVIGWDPRGTGRSNPAIDCVADLDPFFGLDSSPDDQQEHDALVSAAQAFDDACAAKNGNLLAHVSTGESARDMESLRAALGEDTISYFGFSYGSLLGAVWATLFPTTVRAAVFDGAVDPTVGSDQADLQQAKGFEQAFTNFAADCAANKKCPFNNAGDPAAAYDRLAAAIDARPVVVDAHRTPVTNGVLTTAVAQALYSEARWPVLAKALADAAKGNGKGLLALYDMYYQRGSTTNQNVIEAFEAISCLDDGGPRGVQSVDDSVATFVAAAPRFGSDFAHGYVCALWPVPAVAPIRVTGKGAGPIVVVGTTGDPATPFAGTKNMAAALEDGHLVTVDARQHTGYGVNACVDKAVDDYLTLLVVPAVGLVCA